MTGAVSSRGVKIDVWKYLQPIYMGLYAVSEQKFAHLDRVLVHHIFENFDSKMIVVPSQLSRMKEQKVEDEGPVATAATVPRLFCYQSFQNW